MRKYCSLIVLLMAFLLAGNAFADGNKLLMECGGLINYSDGQSERDDNAAALHYGFCLGMMQGVMNMNRYYEVIVPNKALFCAPESGISNEQAARIVVKYLKEHPEQLHENESLLIFEAFRKAYPCR